MAYKQPLLIIHLVISLSQTLHGVATLVPSRSLHLETSLQGCDEDLELKKMFCNRRGFNSVPQHLPIDIEGLDLGSNNITSLMSSTFRRYPLITDLYLSVNDIKVIESTAFHPLKDLDRLDIAANSNLVLSGTGLFKWARKLSHLDVSDSNLRSIPNDILKWSRKLDTVNLRGNLLTVINISSCGTARHVDLSNNRIHNLTEDAFKFVCNSDTLDLTQNTIISVDQNVIASLHVRSLILGESALTIEELKNIFIGFSHSVIENFTLKNGADLSVVPEDLFDPLRDCSLRLLDLSWTHLSAPYPFVFSSLTRLRQFHLKYNGIVTIEPNFFEGMHNLRMLDLKDNNIKDINTDNVSWTIDLIELHLSENALTTIRESTFRGLHNLTLLDLSLNKNLRELEETSFLERTSIQTIDLSQCNIIRFQLIIPSVTSLFLNEMKDPIMCIYPQKSFKNVQLLEHLEMRHTGLRIANLWSLRLNVSLFDGLFNLTAMDLSKNPIYSVAEDLPPVVLQQLSAIQNLSLEDCDLSNLHPQAFTGLKSLRVLILRKNKFQQLPFDLFKQLDQITSIDLVDNFLTYLDGAIFFSNRKLKTLLLSNNRLTRLEQYTFKPLYSSLLFIDLSMNPIDCNCDLSWFLDWLSGPLSLLDDNDDYYGITICSSASLEPLRGKNLIDFDTRELCSINIALVCLPTLAIICLIFIIALVYHYRWQLKYKLFLVKLAAIGYKEMRDARDHNDYEFDLNIIFYDDDEGWIREHLRPALAERLPQFQRNVFGDADLILGMHYLESVDYVVSHSYKTIIVLSSAAVRDRWFILKFRTAMDHVSDTLTEFVVVVFLEDIPDDEMPFLARLYLSDGRPYIHWTEDVRGHEYFFDELKKNLTINLRTNDWIPNE